MSDQNRASTVLFGIGAILVAVVTLGLGVLLLPLLQEIAYNLVIKAPYLWYWLAIGGIVATGLYISGHPTAATAFIGFALIMALLIGPIAGSVQTQTHIVNNQDLGERATLPKTSDKHVRVLPRNVADRYAQSANQLPKYKIGDSDIAYNNGTYTWSYGVVPDRFAVSLFGNQWGSYYVNMEQTDRGIETSRTTMESGMGMMWFDNYQYQLTLDKPLVERESDTAFVFEHDGETHIAQSYENHDWKFGLAFGVIPQPYSVPEYGGTQVMDSEGNIQDLSPSEVEQSEMLEGQNTYPYELARYRIDSMTYIHGALNGWFVGEDVPEIADTGGFSDNQQPFTVPTATSDGSPELTYFVATTPTGSGDGIYQIYTIDSQTGAMEYVEFNETQTGPKKAAGYTRSQNRAPNWAANNDDGSTQITEPIPLTIDGDLYWHMRVTPTDGARVSYTTFVNADSGNVYRAETTEEIYEFVRNGNADEFEQNESSGSDETDTSSGTSDGTITVAVVEDGEVVDTFTVSDDQQVVIGSDNQQNQTATASG